MNKISASAAALLSAELNMNMIITIIVLASIAALLSLFIIALFASKRFRGFFFKEKKAERAEKHETPKPATHVSTHNNTASARPAKSKPTKVKRAHTEKRHTQSARPQKAHTRKRDR